MVLKSGCSKSCFVFFFFNDTATTEIYTLSLHDALPISACTWPQRRTGAQQPAYDDRPLHEDRKSTRLNSSHLVISYAVFCLKKKKNPHILHIYLTSSCQPNNQAHFTPFPYQQSSLKYSL